MMALVNDDLSIAGDEIINRILPNKALNHRDVEATVWFALATSDLSDFLLVDAKEYCELRHPLSKERLSMHEDQCAASTAGDYIGSKDRLSDPRRRHEDPDVMSEKCAGRLRLDGRQFATKGQFQRRSQLSMIVNPQSDVMLIEQLTDFRRATPGQRDMLRQLFRTINHSRSSGGG